MSYNSIEPTVIDEDLLRKAMNEQVASEIGDIARKDGIDPLEVSSLRLDYKSEELADILKIDNLWAFENLTKLQLDNNIIERIENIHFLKNLTWLDLSFNNITRIEGLEGLTKLTDLTLYNNRISKIENMDDLMGSLQVFSIGNNNLTVLENLAYLTQFTNLRVLNLSGNTICKHNNYRNYTLAHVRNLKYLDYRLVVDEAVAAAREKYLDDLIAMEEEDKITHAKKEEMKKKAELDALYQAAHIAGIDDLFDTMFNDDPDFPRMLLPLAREHITTMQEEYRAKFSPIIQEVNRMAQSKQREKEDEHRMLQRCMDEAKSEHDGECARAIKKYQVLKKQLLRMIQAATHSSPVHLSMSVPMEGMGGGSKAANAALLFGGGSNPSTAGIVSGM
ncbi:Dynein regulatory complex subunit 3, partial [Quaeritorhiza haematococci]